MCDTPDPLAPNDVPPGHAMVRVLSVGIKLLTEESDFRGILNPLRKPEFDDLTRSDDLCLVIATAETQIYANILVTIGVVR